MTAPARAAILAASKPIVAAMNTPAHALLNMLVVGRRATPASAAPLALGGVLPDVPIIAFYAVQKLAGTPEAVIWGQRYPQPGWQSFFDVFNSLPLIALLALVAHRAGYRWLLWLAAGLALHAALDMPLHHDDAHRHFWPLTDWRFYSPVSYWDPAHYGRIVSLAEAASSGFAVAWLWQRWPSLGPRLIVAALGAVYIGHWVFVFAVWA